MTKRSISLFLNPVAGRGRARKRIDSIARILDEGDVDYELHRSDGPGDIEQQVYAAVSGGVERLIVAGGDGSIHEAVNGIMRAGGGTALGVIPTGTGNDFAKACSVPLQWEDATRQLAGRIGDEAPARPIDAGCMNDRWFANGAGIGFDAKINKIAVGNRLPFGDLNYLLAVFQGVRDGVITPQVRLQYDGGTYEGAVTMVEVCNGPSVGGMFRIAPMALNDDGHLDLVMVQPVSRLRIFALLPRLLNGSHVDAPEATFARVSSVSLVAEEPVPSHLDGEVQPLASEFRISISKHAFALL